MNKKLNQIDQFVYAQAEKASQDWFERQCLNPYESLYLYYRAGELAVFNEQAPEAFKLGSQTRLSPAWSRTQVKAFIAQAARSLPCLPSELTI